MQPSLPLSVNRWMRGHQLPPLRGYRDHPRVRPFRPALFHRRLLHFRALGNGLDHRLLGLDEAREALAGKVRNVEAEKSVIESVTKRPEVKKAPMKKGRAKRPH